MTRRLWFSLASATLVVLAAFVGNIATGSTPKLGLDLQGGASVILEPVQSGASGSDLTVVRSLIRDELERTGIAEPDVRVQGQTIVVDLPGVNDQQEAIDAVDVSGIVELRPVVNRGECSAEAPTQGPGLTVPPPSIPLPEPGAEPIPDAPVDVAPQPFRSPATVTSEPVTSEPVTSEPATSEPTDGTVPVLDEFPTDIPVDPTIPAAEGNDLLSSREGEQLCVGPSQGTGEVFERQSATVDNRLGFTVNVSLRDGEGQATWNNLAGQCFSGAPTCPAAPGQLQGRLAIVLDGVVQSAPTVNVASFPTGVEITGSFSQGEAEDLANILNRGAFPVEMEAQEARTVSASAGSDSLKAAVIAGLIGVSFVMIFLIAYYRWIALVILGGMAVWSLTVFSVASFVSSATNYSLSLAGVTGIIVAVGVTVDSYVVFFERMKDEIRNGRTLKNAAPRSFKVTWRTIWSADLISVIGAAILFWLSVGSVRGFALFLGITTICDLFVCFFFTRPAVLLLARSRFMAGRRAFGLEVATA